MARLLALEWDDREARLAVASTRGERIVLEQAFRVALRAGMSETSQAQPDVGEVISDALAARRLSRLDTLVAVGRPSIELRHLSLPPSPDAELPDMVRFQAMREFNTLGDDWPLDFLPIAGSAEEPRSVLTAAIAPELVEQIQSTCQTANLKPVRLVLRPCPAASLLLRRLEGSKEQVRLLIDILAEEADLTVTVGPKVVFLRTTRLPGDVFSAEQSGILVAEVRRTIAAVQNQLGGQPVESIYLCGSGRDHVELAGRLTQELSLPAHVFDPFADLDIEGELLSGLPENPGQFAPLLGMLVDEADRTPHAFDFLHPRRRPAPPSRRKTAVVVGALAAAVVLVVGLSLWLVQQSIASDIERLTQEKNGQAAPLKRAAQIEQVVKKIDEWASTEVAWIDELRELSQDMPPAKEAIVTKLSFGPTVAGGQMDLDGQVREASAVDSLETALRDGRHRVEGKGTRQNKDGKGGYAWQFGTVISVTPESQAATVPGKGAAAKPGAPTEKPASGAAKTPEAAKTSPAPTPDKGSAPDKTAPEKATPAAAEKSAPAPEKSPPGPEKSAPTAGPPGQAGPPSPGGPPKPGEPPSPERSPGGPDRKFGPRGDAPDPSGGDYRRNRDGGSRRRRDQ